MNLNRNKSWCRSMGIRQRGFVIGCCLVMFLPLLSACSHKSRVADMQQLKPVMDAGQSEEDKASRLENLSALELLRQGNEYLARNNPQLARLYFAVAVKKDPASAAAYRGLGQALVLAGASSQAQEAFDRSLAIDGNNKAALLMAAKICRGRSDFTSAFEYLKRALALSPGDPEVLTEKAITYDDMGRWADAEPLYLEVVKSGTRQAGAYNNLGFNYLLQGKYREAVNAFNSALGFSRNSKRIRNNLAVAYAYSGQEDKAITLLKGTVGEAGAYNNLGYIYMVRGECERAEQAFRHALDLNPVFYIRANANLERLSGCVSGIETGNGSNPVDRLSMGLGRVKVLEVEPRVDRTPVLQSQKGDEEPGGVTNRTDDSGQYGDRLPLLVKVPVDYLNILTGPDLGQPVAFKARKGEIFMVVDSKGEWLKLLDKTGRTGWIVMSMVEKGGQT